MDAALQRRALAGEQSRGRERSRSRTEGGQAAVAEALRQRAAQSDAAQRYGDDAAVAAFEALRERDAQRERAESASSSNSPRVRERGRGRVIRPIVVNDSSEDGG